MGCCNLKLSCTFHSFHQVKSCVISCLNSQRVFNGGLSTHEWMKPKIHYGAFQNEGNKVGMEVKLGRSDDAHKRLLTAIGLLTEITTFETEQ